MTALAQKTHKRPLGEILVARGLIKPPQLSQALERQKERGGKLGQALVEMGLVSEVDLAEALSAQGKISSVHLTRGMVDRRVADELGPEASWNRKAIAVNRIAGLTTIAMEDPSDGAAVDALSKAVGTDVFPVYAGPEAIQSCLEYFFPKGFMAPSGLEDYAETPESVGEEEYESVDLDALGDPGGDGQPAVQLVRGILEEALSARASDIHLEPSRDALIVRFRVDGGLLERLRLSRYWIRPVMTRLKVLARLDIAQCRLPQDGRIQMQIQGKDVDLRLATMATVCGEGAVLRILDGGRRMFEVEQLGLDSTQLKMLWDVFRARDGFVLVTGPTGAGKTTTLYSVLRELTKSDRKIVTIEDPVENDLDQAFQININPRAGLSFAKALRSVLRLDPDVVLVGEIRDRDTAQIAVEAALTGHLVLSTLSTIGTAETVTRLMDMGVERFLVADTVRGIISQRLVKRICRFCREPAPADEGVLRELGIEGDDGPFYRGKGCAHCLNTGSNGRLALFEVLRLDSVLYELISQGASAGTLYRAALEQGMVTLRSDGIRKARLGETTLDEVLSVTQRSQLT